MSLTARRERHAQGKPVALYERIKQHIMGRIQGGEWQGGARLPSENELVRLLGASRMTVHRALRELSSQGVLSRVQGVGTFVAPPQPRSELLEVRDIADEVHARGHTHASRVVLLEAVRAGEELASAFELPLGAKLFHSILLHSEEEVPVQLEERYVAPSFAPLYLQQDFKSLSPSKYLLGIMQPSELDHVVYAVLTDRRTQKLLKISAAEPCLVVTRRTWVEGIPVTRSVFIHPGSRYSLGNRYRLGASGTPDTSTR